MWEYASAAHDTAVSLTPLWHAQRCNSNWHHCDMHNGVIDTAVQIRHRCDFVPHIRVALATFKGNIYRKNLHRQIDLHYIYNFNTTNMGVMKDRFCDENWRFHSRFSPRIRSHIQKGFNLCIRGLGGVVWWKNQRSKISCQGLFNQLLFLLRSLFWICSSRRCHYED
jgi:hypothetical protein